MLMLDVNLGMSIEGPSDGQGSYMLAPLGRDHTP